ncbi:hypothetical protein QTO30_21515 [Yoonia sp. GPGPB17]|uniref:hypothetical protein n=1 Tax=Yoonia sp. GPGPB17 TaxID=3026147 RepID=UPI0030BCD21C
MPELTISSLGLILLIVPVLVHGIELLYPTQARWVVNWVLPFFAPMLPNRSSSLQLDEQMMMMDAAIEAAPADKKRAGQDYVFLLMFEQRQGAICFAAAALGALYGLTSGIADRDVLHLVFGVIAALMMLVNANQAGLPIFGHNPKISTNGKHVGFVFAPFWATAATLNGLGFSYAVS